MPAMTMVHEVNPSKELTIQNTKLYYEHHPHSDTEAPTIIMIHGFLSSCFSFRKLIPELKKQFHIYALDLPGFGQSEKSRTFFYSLKNYGQLVIDFIEHLQLKNAYIIGHSMGGQVAMHAARLSPEKISFLAYVLWKTLEQWTRRAGLGDIPRTVLDELAQIQSVDVVLPTTDGHTLRVRCVVKPERAQAMLLERLGLELPRRLHMRGPAVPTMV
jgi:pimeloyl-ACP methyl ester carboxylesterase